MNKTIKAKNKKIFSLKELDQAAGMNKTKIFTFPSIKFAATNKGIGELGSFTLLTNKENGDLNPQDLGKELKAIVINRGKFRLKSAEYLSNEVLSSKEKVVVFTKDKFKRYDAGDYYQMKEKYNLSTHQYPYLYLEDGTIAKIIISPSSLSGLWDYLSSFAGNDRVYQYFTILKASEEELKTKGGVYRIINFTQGDKLNNKTQNKVFEAIIDTNQKIKVNDETKNNKDKEYQEQSIGQVKDKDIPVVENETDQANAEIQTLTKNNWFF